MSRRNKAVKRPVPPDPRYDSQTVSKFVNNLMFTASLGFYLPTSFQYRTPR